MDNISSEGLGFVSPVDNFNVRLNLARSDYDVPHAFNLSLVYTLLCGKERSYASRVPRWLDAILGGWNFGLLTLWQSGRVFSYLSGRGTGPTSASSFADYSGDRNIGRVMRKEDGVYWLMPEEIARFTFPVAGAIGTGGRNAFRGPRFFNVDMSLSKQFRLSEQHTISFRAEAYNLFNNVNFGMPNANLSEPATFGRISNTIGSSRMLQMALRYDF